MVDQNDHESAVNTLNAIAAARYEGFIDAIEDGRIFGWALDRENPDQKLTIDFFHGLTLIGQTRADRYRQDLEGYGDGSGKHAFVFNLPKELWAEDSATFHACFEDVAVPLLRGPRCSRLQPIGTSEATDFALAAAPGPDSNWDAVAKRIEACERALVTLVQLAHPGSDYEKNKAVEIRQIGKSVAEIEAAVASLEGFAMRNDSRLKEIESAQENAVTSHKIRWTDRAHMAGFYVCAAALGVVAVLYFMGRGF